MAESIFQRLNEPVDPPTYSSGEEDEGEEDIIDDDDDIKVRSPTTMDLIVPSARRRLMLAKHRIVSQRVATGLLRGLREGAATRQRGEATGTLETRRVSTSTLQEVVVAGEATDGSLLDKSCRMIL